MQNQEHIRKVFALTASAQILPPSDETIEPDMDNSFDTILYAIDTDDEVDTDEASYTGVLGSMMKKV